MNEHATRESSPGGYRRWIVVALLSTHAALLAWGACRHTPTPDEVGSMPAGLSHWTYGRFDLYRVNPPLIRMVATLPVLVANPEIDWGRYREASLGRGEYWLGGEFIRRNGQRAFRLFTLARWICIPFSLLGGYVCYVWARQLYGEPAGYLALTLWCFSPNILAHGQLITTDAGATSLGVAAFYCFWRWLNRPSWQATIATGIVLGLTELTKSTWIVLFVVWPLLWPAWVCLHRGQLTRRRILGQAVKLLTILVVAVYVLNLGYGFEGSFRKLGDYRFASATLSGSKPGAENRFADSWMGRLPVPVPSNYLRGIDQQKRAFEHAVRRSYLRLEWGERGWWYYYLYALAIKVPLGTWMLLLLALMTRLTGRRGRRPWRDELLVLAPLALILIFVSAQTDFTHHLRYVLPIFPFAFIWISQVAQAVTQRRLVAGLTGLALVWSVTSSLWVYPHVLSYFNELAGGPRHGHAHLVGSNIDWGQDLHYLRRWLDKHPEACPLALADHPRFVDPEVLGIEHVRVRGAPLPGERHTVARLLEMGPQPGWHAMRVGAIRDKSRTFAYFLLMKPVAMAGYSIYIYDVTLDEANRVRRELNIPELPDD